MDACCAIVFVFSYLLLCPVTLCSAFYLNVYGEPIFYSVRPPFTKM